MIWLLDNLNLVLHELRSRDVQLGPCYCLIMVGRPDVPKVGTHLYIVLLNKCIGNPLDALQNKFLYLLLEP